VRGYGQYCPIARGAEIFAERWTPIIMRNVLIGCRTFTEISQGAPGLSHTLLTQRLRQLERVGVIERRPAPTGRGQLYLPTAAGEELLDVCLALGTWGARWLEMAPEDNDPYVVLWAASKHLDPDALPPRRVVIRFDFPILRHPNRFWLVLEPDGAELCVKPPGFEEDLVVTAEPEGFAKWHMGSVSWAEVLRDGRVRVEGPPTLARSVPRWVPLSRFAGVRPVAR
jgi:DNA-binding HxlR family transcriptional regulator